MAIRIIVTDSSIWTLDYTEMQYRRDPRNPDTEHPVLSYEETPGWRSFTGLEETGTPWEDRIRFIIYGDEELGYITSTYKPAEQFRDR